MRYQSQIYKWRRHHRNIKETWNIKSTKSIVQKREGILKHVASDIAVLKAEAGPCACTESHKEPTLLKSLVTIKYQKTLGQRFPNLKLQRGTRRRNRNPIAILDI